MKTFGLLLILSSFVMMFVPLFWEGEHHVFTVSPNEIELGELKLNESVEFRLLLGNSSTEDEYSFEIKKSCGCQTLSKERGSLSPKETTFVSGVLTTTDKQIGESLVVLLVEFWPTGDRKRRLAHRVLVNFSVMKVNH